MKELKIKIYGLIDCTKKQYLIFQIIVFSILSLLFIFTFFYDMDKFLFGYARIIILITAFFEFIETYYILKKFNKKEKLNNY